MVLNCNQTVDCLRRNAECLSACRPHALWCCRVANTACGCHKGAVHRSGSSDGLAPPPAAAVPVAARILDAKGYTFHLFGANRMCSPSMLACCNLSGYVDVVQAVLDASSIGSHHVHTCDNVLPCRRQQQQEVPEAPAVTAGPHTAAGHRLVQRWSAGGVPWTGRGSAMHRGDALVSRQGGHCAMAACLCWMHPSHSACMRLPGYWQAGTRHLAVLGTPVAAI